MGLAKIEREKVVGQTRRKEGFQSRMDEEARRSAYRLLAQQIDIKELVLEERMEVLENGLDEKGEESREEVRNLLKVWLQQSGEMVTFLQHLDLTRGAPKKKRKKGFMTMASMTGPAQAIWLLVDSLILQEQCPRNLVRQFLEENLDSSLTIPYPALSLEKVLYWKVLTFYLMVQLGNKNQTRKFEAFVWTILPDVRSIFSYVISYITMMQECDDWKFISSELLEILSVYIVSCDKENRGIILKNLKHLLACDGPQKVLYPIVDKLVTQLGKQDKLDNAMDVLADKFEELKNLLSRNTNDGEETPERKAEIEQAKQEMSNENIDKIVKLLESPIKSRKPNKKKKPKVNKEGNQRADNIDHLAVCSKTEESNVNILEKKKPNDDNDLFKKAVDEKLIMIKKQRDQIHFITKSKLEEIAVLKTDFEESKNQISLALAEIAAIDARRIQLEKECEQKSEKTKKFEMKLKTAENSIAIIVQESKSSISCLENDVKLLEAKRAAVNPNAEQKSADINHQPNLKYLESISLKISAKESELECPVCLETASAPIYMCMEQHLVCGGCRPRIASCPECRQPYNDVGEGAGVGVGAGYRRHRYAERAAEELEALWREKELIPQ